MPFPQRVWLLFGSLSPSKFGDKISSFADLGCLSQKLDPESEFFPSRSPDPGSTFFPSQIPDSRIKIFSVRDPWSGSASKNLSILAQKMISKLSEIWSGFFIPDPDPDFLAIPDPNLGSQILEQEVKNAPDPRSQILDPDPQHWRFWICSGCSGYRRLLTFYGTCCLDNSFNWSALRSFYVQKWILCIFLFLHNLSNFYSFQVMMPYAFVP